MGTVQFAIRAGIVPHIFNKSVNFPINATSEAVFKQSISCTPLTLGVEIGMSVTTYAQIPIRLTVDGSLVPPKIKDLAISSTGERYSPRSQDHSKSFHRTFCIRQWVVDTAG
jgi:hypothetical protein